MISVWMMKFQNQNNKRKTSTTNATKTTISTKIDLTKETKIINKTIVKENTIISEKDLKDDFLNESANLIKTSSINKISNLLIFNNWSISYQTQAHSHF